MKNLKRIGALLAAICLLLLVIMTLVFAITGSKYFLASMVSMIFIPIFIYGAVVVYGALKK